MGESKTTEAATPTTRVIYLGTVTRENPDETFAVDINADPDAIRAALEATEQGKRDAAAREFERLRELFNLPDETRAGDEPPPPTPRARDWLVP